MKIRLDQCTVCRGAKQIMGMGMLPMACNECNGKGLIETMLDEAIGGLKELAEEALAPRRGRKPKVIDGDNE